MEENKLDEVKKVKEAKVAPKQKKEKKHPKQDQIMKLFNEGYRPIQISAITQTRSSLVKKITDDVQRDSQ